MDLRPISETMESGMTQGRVVSHVLALWMVMVKHRNERREGMFNLYEGTKCPAPTMVNKVRTNL